MPKLCIVCHERPAVVPDRNSSGRPIKAVCRECHAGRLQSDLRTILPPADPEPGSAAWLEARAYAAAFARP